MVGVGERLLQESIRHKLGLARWEAGLVRQVIGLLDATDADLERRIALAVERHASDDAVRRLQRIRAELRSANVEAHQAVRRALSAELQEAADRQGRWQARQLSSALPVAWSASRPSAELLRAIATSQPFQGDLLAGHVERLAGNRLGDLSRAVEVGLAQGESLSQLLQRVRGTRQGKFRDGVLQIGRQRAEALTRTAAQHVTESARELTIRANLDIVRGVMWVATLDHRTCRRCQPRDGLVWDLRDGAWVPVGHDQPWAGGPGKIHWLCRCTQIPVLRDLAELDALGIGIEDLGPGERAALGEPVPVTTSYPEWIREQPLEIQVAALGRRRAEALRAGGSLDEVWALRFVPALAVPAQLDEVLPAGPPSGAEVRRRLEDVLGSATEAEVAARAALAEAEEQLAGAWRELSELRSRRRGTRRVEARLDEARGGVERARERVREVAAPARRAMRDLLAEGKDGAQVTMIIDPGILDRSSEAQARIQEALDFVTAAWGRQHALPRTVRFAQADGGRANYERGVIRISLRSPSKTVVHELGHWLEDVDEALHRRLVEYYEARTKGDRVEPLSLLAPGRGYGIAEQGKADKWIDPYMGRLYVRSGLGYVGLPAWKRQHATEILSMGLERLFSDPRDLLARDPELFELLVDLLAGRQ